MAKGSGEVSADPYSNGGNHAGVFFQELVVPLEGEPATYPMSVHLSGPSS